MNYMDYLSEAKVLLENCCKACTVWTYPYNGENPPHEVFQDMLSPDSNRTFSPEPKWSDSEANTVKNDSSSETKNCDIKVSGIDSICTDSSQISSIKDCSNGSMTNLTCSTSADDVFLSDMSTRSSIPEVSEVLRNIDWSCLDDSGAPSEDVSEFLDYLQDVGTPPEEDLSIQTSIQTLGTIFSSLQSLSNSRTSVPCDKSNISKQDYISVSKCLSISKSSETVDKSENDKTLLEKSSVEGKVKFEGGDVTTLEVKDSVTKPIGSNGNPNCNLSDTSKDHKKDVKDSKVKFPDDTSYFEITMSALPHTNSLPSNLTTTQNLNTTQCSDASNDSSTKRSVSFSLPPSSMQNTVGKVPSGVSLANAPSIGKSV